MGAFYFSEVRLLRAPMIQGKKSGQSEKTLYEWYLKPVIARWRMLIVAIQLQQRACNSWVAKYNMLPLLKKPLQF